MRAKKMPSKPSQKNHVKTSDEVHQIAKDKQASKISILFPPHLNEIFEIYYKFKMHTLQENLVT